MIFRKNTQQISLSEKLYQKVMAGKRVLFVDNDELMKTLAERLPEKFMMDLTIVNTATEAKQLSQQEEMAHFDVVVLDVGIVNGDGISLYRWLKERFPRLMVIFLTGYPPETIEPKIREVGSAPIYYKPAAMNEGFMEDLFMRMGLSRRAGQTT